MIVLVFRPAGHPRPADSASAHDRAERGSHRRPGGPGRASASRSSRATTGRTTIVVGMALVGLLLPLRRRPADPLRLPAPDGVDRRLHERRRVRPARRRPQPRRRRRRPARPRLRRVLRDRLVRLRLRRVAVRQPDPRASTSRPAWATPPGSCSGRCCSSGPLRRGDVRRPARGTDAAAARRLPRHRHPGVRRDRPDRVPRGGHGDQRHQRHRRHLPPVAAGHRRLHRHRRDPVLRDDAGRS